MQFGHHLSRFGLLRADRTDQVLEKTLGGGHLVIELFQQALVGAVVVVETLVQSSDQILELQDVTLKANDFFFGTGSKRPGNQEENERQVLLHKRGVVKQSADDEVGTPVTSVGCFVLAGVGRSLLAE